MSINHVVNIFTKLSNLRKVEILFFLDRRKYLLFLRWLFNNKPDLYSSYPSLTISDTGLDFYKPLDRHRRQNNDTSISPGIFWKKKQNNSNKLISSPHSQ